MKLGELVFTSMPPPDVEAVSDQIAALADFDPTSRSYRRRWRK